MVLIRFGSDRPSPPWLAKLHGFAAAGALSLLVFGWANVSFPRSGLYGLLMLLAAAAAGLFLNLGYRWRRKPLPEWLVFAHMAIAFIGFLPVGVVSLSPAPQNTDQPVRRDRLSNASAPTSELPAALSPGDQTAIEARRGAIARMPPPTPLLPGKPTRNAKSPEAS